MKHASLFSGIGGPEVAAAMLGWENAFHCEINPFGRAVLEYWFPESTSYEDITKTDFRCWRGKIDVLTGGFPCQPFSYAGKRGGREDERYLWPQMLRAIGEIRPAWVVGENVAGITTMVEGWVCTDLGGSPTLFGEVNDIHEYALRQSFTIERICRDLERLGYTVQPVLIPAAAVGAPHRRDRVFILAHADADRRDDVRITGKDAGKSGEERDKVRLAGVADQLRSEIQGSAEIPEHVRRCIGKDDQQGNQRDIRDAGAGDSERVCGEAGSYSSDTNGWRSGALPIEVHSRFPDGDQFDCAWSSGNASDTDCTGRQEPVIPGRGEDCEEIGEGLHDRAERPRRDGNVTNTEVEQHGEPEPRERENSGRQKGTLGRDNCEGFAMWNDSHPVCEGLEREDEPWSRKEGQRMQVRGNLTGHDWEDLLPENRWRDFPTVTPVHRGNDGIPFDVDGLAVPPMPGPPTYGKGDPKRYPFSKWRTESLKAYGNAIVPQVMYRIFQAIEQATHEKDNV